MEINDTDDIPNVGDEVLILIDSGIEENETILRYEKVIAKDGDKSYASRGESRIAFERYGVPVEEADNLRRVSVYKATEGGRSELRGLLGDRIIELNNASIAARDGKMETTELSNRIAQLDHRREWIGTIIGIYCNKP